MQASKKRREGRGKTSIWPSFFVVSQGGRTSSSSEKAKAELGVSQAGHSPVGPSSITGPPSDLSAGAVGAVTLGTSYNSSRTPLCSYVTYVYIPTRTDREHIFKESPAFTASRQAQHGAVSSYLARNLRYLPSRRTDHRGRPRVPVSYLRCLLPESCSSTHLTL